MHAASVHPEPGSNSRKNFISDTRRCLTSSRAIYLSFTFCLSSILNKLWRDQYLHLQCFVLLSCCSIFNDRATAFSATAWLFYHILLYLSSLFLKFFINFFEAWCCLVLRYQIPSFWWGSFIIHHSWLFVNSFRQFFYIWVKLRDMYNNNINIL